eukprot:CAMPEP_0173162958 /NCGR_PEP_ID=MMETSP1105-20130129/19625_1 /TAXON_ID=2985 /ORGANISM="Ochromonas sp., Strain BG-1" /LENGTH=739 /DNA_ID=CAMNT_0014082903 /DNA_START=191 /DNA_END=2410 /DNA_ORIENTATION=-
MAAFEGKGATTTQSNTADKASMEKVARWGFNLESTEEIDDWSSQWKECLEGRAIWGGRTLGGRGVQKITGFTKDISVEGITLAFCGKELLQRTTLKLTHGHRYGLIGENGVGKSTLLRRIAKQSIPGIPLHFRFGYVQQELLVTEDVTVLDYILKANAENETILLERLESLRAEEKEIEELMDNTTDNDELGDLAEKLCDISDKIDATEQKLQQKQEKTGQTSSSPATITRASIEALGPSIVNVLDGLGLSKPLKRLSMNISELSGGWRMRAALAQCLCHLSDVDVLLLDEPTNHLDLPTIAWLQDFLVETNLIILLVSHDRFFLNAVATDIIEMKNQSLEYFAGGYEDWMIHMEEMAARKANLVDARVRKETHIKQTIEAAHARGDDKTAKAKQKKLERAGFTKGIDGHRYKNFSIKKLDMKYLHLAEKVDLEPEKDFRYAKFKYPIVDAASLRLPTDTSPLLTLEKCSITYDKKPKNVLDNVTLQLHLKSRVGIIGRNGRGKTTLLQALCYGESLGVVKIPHDPSSTLTIVKGQVWKHHNLRIGIVAQHQIDLLSNHLYETPLSYVQRIIATSVATQPYLAGYYKTDLEIRAHLGAFGLSGNLALQQIGSLSGGQKARLSFSIVCLCRPHLLFLDEPSNHLSMDSIESLITACQEFTGGVVIISHNRYLISRICNEVWLVDKNTVAVRKPLVTDEGNEKKKGGGGSRDSDSDGEGGSGLSPFDELLDECIQQILASA